MEPPIIAISLDFKVNEQKRALSKAVLDGLVAKYALDPANPKEILAVQLTGNDAEVPENELERMKGYASDRPVGVIIRSDRVGDEFGIYNPQGRTFGVGALADMVKSIIASGIKINRLNISACHFGRLDFEGAINAFCGEMRYPPMGMSMQSYKAALDGLVIAGPKPLHTIDKITGRKIYEMAPGVFKLKSEMTDDERAKLKTFKAYNAKTSDFDDADEWRYTRNKRGRELNDNDEVVKRILQKDTSNNALIRVVKRNVQGKIAYKGIKHFYISEANDREDQVGNKVYQKVPITSGLDHVTEGREISVTHNANAAHEKISVSVVLSEEERELLKRVRQQLRAALQTTMRQSLISFFPSQEPLNENQQKDIQSALVQSIGNGFAEARDEIYKDLEGKIQTEALGAVLRHPLQEPEGLAATAVNAALQGCPHLINEKINALLAHVNRDNALSDKVTDLIGKMKLNSGEGLGKRRGSS